MAEIILAEVTRYFSDQHYGFARSTEGVSYFFSMKGCVTDQHAELSVHHVISILEVKNRKKPCLTAWQWRLANKPELKQYRSTVATDQAKAGGARISHWHGIVEDYDQAKGIGGIFLDNGQRVSFTAGGYCEYLDWTYLLARLYHDVPLVGEPIVVLIMGRPIQHGGLEYGDRSVIRWCRLEHFPIHLCGSDCHFDRTTVVKRDSGVRQYRIVSTVNGQVIRSGMMSRLAAFMREEASTLNVIMIGKWRLEQRVSGLWEEADKNILPKAPGGLVHV